MSGTSDSESPDQWGPATQAVRGGMTRSPFGETAEAMFLTQSFVYDSAEAANARFAGENPGYIYSRYANPTVKMFEDRLALIEGAEFCRSTASGMAAIFTALSGLVRAGDHILASRALFGSCRWLLTEYFPRFGVETSVVDGPDLAQWEKGFRPNTRAVLIESPANPLLEVVDVAAICALAHAAGAKVIVLTPSFQNPTGATLPAAARKLILSLTRAAGAIVIENDIYSELAYAGGELPRLKSLDPNVILLGSFSKIAFPGMRCGWIIAPKPVIARATELKGRPREEVARAVEQAARKHLSACKFTLPNGGMNLWLDLPDGLDASALRGLAQQAGVDYLPGRYFSVSRPLDSGLRLSFAGLEPNEIRRGIELLGGVIGNAGVPREEASRPTLAMV